MQIADGFPGQRMLVLPRGRAREFLDQPGVNHVVVTDCGYFPKAQSHGRARRSGLAQMVVLVCASGSGWCETAAGRFEVEAGQVVVLPPGFPHAYGANGDDPWTLWWVHVAGPELSSFCASAGLTIEAPVHGSTDTFRLVTLVTEVVQWMERDSTSQSLLAAAGAAWHLIALLVANRSTSDSSAEVIDQAAGYLRSHISEHISVAELAAIARLSPSHFSALFKKRIGYPVLHYQTQLRMARARELLDTTALPIAAIAESVGYQDAFYFARQFHRVHGITPRDYRARHRS